MNGGLESYILGDEDFQSKIVLSRSPSGSSIFINFKLLKDLYWEDIEIKDRGDGWNIELAEVRYELGDIFATKDDSFFIVGDYSSFIAQKIEDIYGIRRDNIIKAFKNYEKSKIC